MAIPIEDLTKIEVLLRDPENSLVKLIEYIRRTAGPGHSFEVVVDPDMSEYRKSFFMDGDGSFSIRDVKKDGKKVEIEKDKLIEKYLYHLTERKAPKDKKKWEKCHELTLKKHPNPDSIMHKLKMIRCYKKLGGEY